MKTIDRHFCLVPLRFQLGNEGDRILCLTQHKEDLIISITGGIFYTCQISNLDKNSKEIKYTAKIARIDKLKKDGTEITKLGSIGETLLALIKKPTDDYGNLISIISTHIVPIAKNVLCFDVNTPNTFSHDISPMFAAVVGQEIRIFTYTAEANANGETNYSWKKSDTDISIQAIRCIAFSYPFILSINDQGFSYITLQENASPIINSSRAPTNEHSYCMSYLTPKYFSYYDKKAVVITDPQADFKTLNTKISLEENYFEHTHAGNEFASVSDSTIAIYNFMRQSNKLNRLSIIRFPGCKHIAAFDQKYFIATSDTQFYLVTDVTNATNKILEGNIDEAIESLSYVNADILGAMFDQLWIKDYKIYALSMLKYKEIYPALYDICSLFKMIKLLTCGNSVKYISFAEQTEDQKLAKVLTDNLLAIRSSKALIDNKSNSTENNANRTLRMIIDTTLFEIYAYQEDIGNLSSFINECPELSNESIDAFFNGAETVSRAMYLAYIGNSNDSLEMFKKLENLNTVVLDQVTRIVTSGDWDFCKENLQWLFEVSPLHACKVLTSDSISSNDSINFCLKNKYAEDYYYIVLYGVLDHKDIYNRAELVNEYAQHIFQLLLEINDPSFDRKRVAFCNCVIENTSTETQIPIEKIKEELSDDFINVLRRFPKEVHLNSPVYQTNQISSNPRVQVEIYRASGEVEKALRLLWEENEKNKNDKDFTSIIQDLENFCKESDNTSVAFQILIKLLKEKMPKEQGVKTQMGILSRNMNMIDVPKALENINEDESVENVADFLEETYRTLVTMRKDAELDAAFAESNEFESTYQRIKLESQVIEIRNDTFCPKCKKPLNSNYFFRAPNGNLFHFNCKLENNS